MCRAADAFDGTLCSTSQCSQRGSLSTWRCYPQLFGLERRCSARACGDTSRTSGPTGPRTSSRGTWDLSKIGYQDSGSVGPTDRSDPWVYATIGASSVGSEGERVEFFLLAPSESPRHVETLAMVAGFYALAEHDLSLGDTVNIGRPWADGSGADHLLVSLPYPFGPTLERLEVGGELVRILWLVPITEPEARFASLNGAEELERLFDDEGADVLSVVRPSMV